MALHIVIEIDFCCWTYDWHFSEYYILHDETTWLSRKVLDAATFHKSADLNPLNCCLCYSISSICMPRICLRNRVYVVVVVVVVVVVAAAAAAAAAMVIERYDKERNVSIVRKDNLRLAMTYSEHWIKCNCHMRVCTYHKLPRYASHNFKL